MNQPKTSVSQTFRSGNDSADDLRNRDVSKNQPKTSVGQTFRSGDDSADDLRNRDVSKKQPKTSVGQTFRSGDDSADDLRNRDVSKNQPKTSVGQTFRSGDDSANDPQSKPRFRPRERFWPYAELPESPTPEEIAALDPELRDALYGATARPFSVTLVFPKFEGPDYARAVELARESAQYLEVGTGDAFRVRARFYPQAAQQLHELFEIVGPQHECEVLIDDKPFPFARELWLPLIWFLLPQE